MCALRRRVFGFRQLCSRRVIGVVGVAGDFDLEDLGVVGERRSDGVEHREALLADDLLAVLVEVDDALDLELFGSDIDERCAVGAAVLVLVAVERFRLIGALVFVVGNSVVVAIGDLVGTAVFVLEAVEDLGLVDALIVGVHDSVAVVVGIGASVGILEAVGVLGLVGAFVDLVG